MHPIREQQIEAEKVRKKVIPAKKVDKAASNHQGSKRTKPEKLGA